ncbi:MAG: pyridoxamine 5'-phosphate oxidase family protein [Nitrospira sp.]|nr:pyridoxamine 5'-phosphate oxidase family protein [Nitrospira sp.]
MSSSRQHNSGPESDGPEVPEPSHAERARTLLYLQQTGSLSTLSRKQPGWPFGSVMPYGLDAQGQPVFLISTMAMHTQNLLGDPRASLLVTPPESRVDPLGAARVTLMGSVTKVPKEENAEVRACYLGRHANASYWVDYQDFGFFRMAITEIYFVGGFGSMGWVTLTEYVAAAVDPLAAEASNLIRELNIKQAETLLALARTLGHVEAQQATVTALDRLGFHLRFTTPDRMQGGRVAFPAPVLNELEVRASLAGLADQVNAGLPVLHSL